MLIKNKINWVSAFVTWMTIFHSSQSQAIANKLTISKQQILHVGNGAEPKELDTAIATGLIEAHILDNLFEGLTTIDPFTTEPIPGVAESWTLSQDAKTYTFKIRKNALWSDGKEITADDFVWSWTRVLNPTTASEYAYQLYYVKNAESFNKGKMKDPKQLGFKVLDKYTLQVQLENPTPFFLRLTAFHTLYPTPKHVIEKFPGQDWTRDSHIVSNGAFKLAEWKLNQHVKLVANENYWDKSAVQLKEIYVYPTENIDTEEKNFTAGKIHMTFTVPALRIPFYKDMISKKPDAYHVFKADPFLAVYFYRFNVTRKPMDNPMVRRALALTIDRKLLVENVLKGGQTPARSFTPPVANYSFKGNLPESVSDKDIKEAKNLLTQAGYPDGKNMPKIEILYNTDADNKRIAVAIQGMWKKNLGIDVGLFNQEWKVYLDSQNKLNYDIARARWVGDYPDPNTFLDMFVTNGGNNNTGWSNKQYDEWIAKAAAQKDQGLRYEAFKKAEEILMKELPVVPIYIFTNTKLVSEKVKMYNPKTKEISAWKSDIMDRQNYKYYVMAD